MKWATKQPGFTIVELLIVIVVIAILAAITLVSYNGIKERALVSQIQTTLASANKKILAYATVNSDMYPDTLADAGLVAKDGAVWLQYKSDNTTSPKTYSITASDGAAGARRYYLSNSAASQTVGTAPGQNLVEWDETDPASIPLTAQAGVTVSTSVAHTGTSSLQIAPTYTQRMSRLSPFSGTSGQVMTVTIWIITDANWDGSSSNSKIRIADSSGLLTACSYAGVKTSWTQISCTHSFTAARPDVSVMFGNDGTTGNIWLDDISISIK